MSIGPLLRKDMAIGSVTTVLMLVSAHAGSISVETLVYVRDSLQILFAVAVGLAIPGQLAWQARRMIAGVAMTHLQGTIDAVTAIRELAEQAEYELVVSRQAERYCTTVFNQSQIDHAIRHVDQVDLSLLPNEACKLAVDNARANLHRFFGTLRHAVSEFNDMGQISEDGVQAIHRAYKLCVRDTQTMHREWALLNRSNCSSYVSPSENP